MEHAGAIPKLADLNLPPDLPMAINCEWYSCGIIQANFRGAFDNEHLALPRTNYDVAIDHDSPRPGQQAFEKMIAGYYLGEVFRLVLLDLSKQGVIFEGKDLTKLTEPYSIDTSTLAEIESDPFENLIETGDMFIQKFSLECTEPELRLIRRLAELIGLRAARLSACGVAAICKKKNIQVRLKKYLYFFSESKLINLGLFCWSGWICLYEIPSFPGAPPSRLDRNLWGRPGEAHCYERGRRWKRVRYQFVLSTKYPALRRSGEFVT
jgi:hexokinase